MTSHFEARLHGFRRTQDGVVISYVVHPQDLSSEMAMASLGTRYMVAFSEIGDNEAPVAQRTPDGKTSTPDGMSVVERVHDTGSSPVGSRQSKPFKDLRLSNQAALRCNDEQFKLYLMDEYPSVAAKYHDAADVVRELCGVKSRSEFDSGTERANRWCDLESEYQDWLTEKRYKDAYR